MEKEREEQSNELRVWKTPRVIVASVTGNTDKAFYQYETSQYGTQFEGPSS
jgi:hypothetical protein